MGKQAPAVLVTGAGRGLGRGIALEAARRGYSVIINYAGNREAAEECAALCAQAAEASRGSQEFPVLQADISRADERQQLVDFSFDTFPHIAALVNNAGIAPVKRCDMLDLEEDSFDRLMAVNLKGPWFLSSLFSRRWIASGQDVSDSENLGTGDPGSRKIIFVTSVSAETASVNRAEYCLSKAALAMANKLYAARLADEGISVFEVRPGIMATDMTSGVASKYDHLLKEGLVPQKRWGEAIDTGRAVASLLQGDFDFSTGNVFYVDGGFHISRL